MKRSLLPLTILLPILAAATSSAQMAMIRFAAPVNPIAGLPKLLPSPMTGPLAGTGITLPSLVPALTPSMSLTAYAPVPALFLPMSLPSREGRIPATPAQPSRGGAGNPLHRMMPDVFIRFGEQAAPSKPGASKEKLDEAFDGESDPSKPAVELPRRRPVSPGRRIGLPEWELERELGI